jgi:hypothetical protein
MALSSVADPDPDLFDPDPGLDEWRQINLFGVCKSNKFCTLGISVAENLFITNISSN